MKPLAKYLWLDLETTGLYPERGDRILECCAIATDAELREIEDQAGSCVFMVPDEVLVGMDDFVRAMHTRSGLLADVEKAGACMYDLERWLLDLIDRAEWDEGKPILAGATVHFDRGFLKRWVPFVEARLHHRHLDVSSLKLAKVDVTGAPFAKAEAHRAEADVRESLAQAREIFAALRRGYAG